MWNSRPPGPPPPPRISNPSSEPHWISSQPMANPVMSQPPPAFQQQPPPMFQDPMQQQQYYQSMPTHQVDWAALAQQWIAHRSVEPEMPHQKPPKPDLSLSQSSVSSHVAGGEANMDVEDESESAASAQLHVPVFKTNVPPPSIRHSNGKASVQPHQAMPSSFSVPPPVRMPPLALAQQPVRSSMPSHHSMHQHHHHNHIHPHHKPPSAVFPTMREQAHIDHSAFADLDAAARKKLPSWIREGLEKMEREKAKKEEFEKRMQMLEERKRMERENLLQEIQDQKQDPSGSKFDEMGSSDEESGSELDNQLKTIDKKLSAKKSRFDVKDESVTSGERRKEVESDDDENGNDEPTLKREAKPSRPVSKEEILEEMMFVLKRTLTEVLLDVTTEEIEKVAHESIEREKRLSVSSTSKKKLGNLLSSYGSSDEESDSNDNEDKIVEEGEKESDLEETIRRKKKQFQKIKEKINRECDRMDENYKEREQLWMEDKPRPERKRYFAHFTENSSPRQPIKSEKYSERSKEKLSPLDENESSIAEIPEQSHQQEEKSHNHRPRSRSRERSKRSRSRDKSKRADGRERRRSRSHDRSKRSKSKERKRSKSRDRRKSKSPEKSKRSPSSSPRRKRSKSRERGRRRRRSSSSNVKSRSRSTSRTKARKRSRSRLAKRNARKGKTKNRSSSSDSSSSLKESTRKKKRKKSSKKAGKARSRSRSSSESSRKAKRKRKRSRSRSSKR